MPGRASTGNVWLFVRNHEDLRMWQPTAVRRALGAWQRGRGPRGDPHGLALPNRKAPCLSIATAEADQVAGRSRSVDETFDEANSLG